MIVVYVKKGEPLERALKRFRQKYMRSGHYKDLKRSRYYIKPSDKRKLARKRAEKREKRQRRLLR